MTFREKMTPWAEEFLSLEQHPMDGETSKAFVNLLLSEMKGGDIPSKIYETFSFKLVKARAEGLGLSINDQTTAFLCCLCNSPGVAVMYITAISYKTKEVTMNTLAQLFGMGFPSDADVHAMWEKQKGRQYDVKVDNMLDCVEPLQ